MTAARRQALPWPSLNPRRVSRRGPGGTVASTEAAGLEAATSPGTGTSDAGAATAGGEGHPARWWIMAVLAAVAFMAQLDLFIVNVALPVIGQSYRGASLSGLSWVLNAYAII